METVTCSPAQLSATYASATAGDTIQVTSGTVSWSPTLSKRVSIIGGYGGGTTQINGALYFLPTLGQDQHQLRVSNCTIYKTGTGVGEAAIIWGSTATHYNLGGINPYNARLDHCLIYGCTTTVRFTDCLYGVIDHCQFGTPASRVNYAVYNEGSYTAVPDFGNSVNWPWYPGMAGNGKSAYFEDNIVYVAADGCRPVGHNCGGRTCFRYNTINLSDYSQAWMDIHGTQDASSASAWGVECYGNYAPTGDTQKISDTRSGQNMIYWNAAANLGSAAQNYWGVYMVCPATLPDEQCIHDNYLWNNRAGFTGALGEGYTGTTGSCGSYANRPLAGRDYFDDSTTTPRITSGTLANRPATCVTGQGYWATDQTTGLTNLTNYVGDITNYPSRLTIAGTFYKATATNTWTEWYSPYTYPHPLISGSASPPVGTPVLSVR